MSVQASQNVPQSETSPQNTGETSFLEILDFTNLAHAQIVLSSFQVSPLLGLQGGHLEFLLAFQQIFKLLLIPIW